MENNTLILGQDQYYNMDSYETKLNNNVLVVGASGSGKTRSIVTPNLLQANGSYILTDPKGNLYEKYGDYMKSQGYEVKKLDFTDPKHSCHYNIFDYIKSSQDILKVAHMLMYQHKNGGHHDPFWDEAGQLLVQSTIAFLMEATPKRERTLSNLLNLTTAANSKGELENCETPLDILMNNLKEKNPESYAVKTYEMFRVSPDKTLRSILITVNARLASLDTPELVKMMERDEIDIASIGRKKTALFVIVSDTDRSVDPLVNIFFSQAMNELCRYADKYCSDNRLPVPVRFILDDFATTCKILDFPRMISSIRSRNISAMLMVQAESQLEEYYEHDAKTIISNCDSYVYLGGNDIETARAVSERCDVPLKKILNMPVETNWIFRRGRSPVNGTNFMLEPFLAEKGIKENKRSHEIYARLSDSFLVL